MEENNVNNENNNNNVNNDNNDNINNNNNNNNNNGGENKSNKRVIIIVSAVVGGLLILALLIFGIVKAALNSFTAMIPYDDEYYYDDDYDAEYEVDTGDYWNESNSNKTSSKEVDPSQGKIYNKVVLNDTQARVAVYEGLIPKGWTATVNSNWNVVSSVCPGLETVTISSPDGKVSIVLDSNQAFSENPSYNEGINTDYYTTYLHYMDADEFIDYYMQNVYSGYKLIKDLEKDQDIIDAGNSMTNIYVEQAKKDAQTIGVENYGMSFTINAVPATMSRRQYMINNGYLECNCAVVAVDQSLASKYGITNNTRNWNVPYSIVYWADSQESFDKYYDDYNFIVANSQFTRDYYAMVEYVSSAIVNSVSSYYAAKSQAGLDAMNNYIDSNYSSTSSQSTNDKVMEMWDDVIKEVDSYRAEDGTQIKTSIMNDTIAQNGDSFYVGSKAGIPLGYNELAKSY